MSRLPLHRYLNVVYFSLVRTMTPEGRADFDERLAELDRIPVVRPPEDTDAPDWWHGEEAEAMAMMAQMKGGQSRG